MKLPILAAIITFSFLLVTLDKASTRIYGNYTGWNTCAECHAAIAKSWAATRHAKAFDSLKKSGQENIPGCVKCHVTGYDRDGGFIDYELTPEMRDVQCEECHGEGKKHVGEGGTAAAIHRSVSSEICRRCHTPGQDKHFDYQKKVRLVHALENGSK